MTNKITIDEIREVIQELIKESVILDERMTYAELLKLTVNTPRSPKDDTNRIDRSKNVRVRSIPISVEEGLEQWNFRYKSDSQNTITNKPFQGHITFLKGELNQNDDAQKVECEVECTCPDYIYRFKYNNKEQDAGGDDFNTDPHYINRKPKLPYDIGPGLCKHLVALSRFLQTKIINTKKPNIFEALHDIVNKGPFDIKYNE